MTRLPTLTIVAAIATATSCGGGDAAGPATPTPDSTSTSSPTSAATAGGTITVGDTRYDVVAGRQCSFFPGGVIYIAGHVAGDPDTEFNFDDFTGAGTEVNFGLFDGEVEAWAADTSIEYVVDGERVRGTAELITPSGPTPATFELSCDGG